MTEQAPVYRSRYQICDTCECVTIVQRNNARGVPDEVDWDQFPGCMVCGGSMLHWDADEKSQDDIYWDKGFRAGAASVTPHEVHQVWAVTYDSDTPFMDGTHPAIRMADQALEIAQRNFALVQERSARAPKRNLRIETRFVTDWQTYEEGSDG